MHKFSQPHLKRTPINYKNHIEKF